jgi:hypothetical protein
VARKNERGKFMNPQEIIQIVTVLVCIAGLSAEIVWSVRYPKKRYYTSSIIGIYIHNIIFYACVLIFPRIEELTTWKLRIFPLLFSYWSAARILHIVVALTLISMYRLYYDKTHYRDGYDE